MICCGHCGVRNWKGEEELARWRALALTLLVTEGHQGHRIIGTGPTSTLAWVDAHVRVRFERDGEAFAVRWDAPRLKPEGV